MRYALVFLLIANASVSKAQIDIYGIDILQGQSKKELKQWEQGSGLGVLKKDIAEETCPFTQVYRQPNNEYIFKTDRGNYENMADRFRMAYKYLEKKFGDASLMETPMGSITDLRLKRYPNGKVYFFTHKWDFDAREYYADRGDTLTVQQVYKKIISHNEYILLEWSSLQKYGVLIRMKWRRSGLSIKVLNFNPQRTEEKKGKK